MSQGPMLPLGVTATSGAPTEDGLTSDQSMGIDHVDLCKLKVYLTDVTPWSNGLYLPLQALKAFYDVRPRKEPQPDESRAKSIYDYMDRLDGSGIWQSGKSKPSGAWEDTVNEGWMRADDAETDMKSLETAWSTGKEAFETHYKEAERTFHQDIDTIKAKMADYPLDDQSADTLDKFRSEAESLILRLLRSSLAFYATIAVNDDKLR